MEALKKAGVVVSESPSEMGAAVVEACKKKK